MRTSALGEATTDKFMLTALDRAEAPVMFDITASEQTMADDSGDA
jgi:hypothetical protein